MTKCLQETQILPPRSNPITLHIKGLGHIPSFKNRKMICRNRLITDPKYKARMDAIIEDIKSQLLSLCQTEEKGTWMECWEPFSTQYVPQDDNWMIVSQLSVDGKLTEKGKEGAIITIEQL